MSKEASTVNKKKTETKKRYIIKIHREAIRLARRDLINLILFELNKVDAFWKFRHRVLVTQGFGVPADSAVDIGVEGDDIIVVWTVRVVIPYELCVQLAELRKRKLLKIPRPHQFTRRKLREAEDAAERLLAELKEPERRDEFSEELEAATRSIEESFISEE